MPAAIDMTGQIYGRLIGIKKVPNHGVYTAWLFWCECGNFTEIPTKLVTRGNTKSCGCLLRDHKKTHGMDGTRTHRIWKNMIQRCHNPNSKDYRWYGSRGIKVCDHWRDFKNFYNDMGESNGLTIDRIDNDKGYAPDNCRWATLEQQRSNKRSH